MPTKPLGFCSVPGCSARVSSGRCAAHQSQPREWHHLYDRRRWRRERLRFLHTHPLCETCKAEGAVVASAEVDHHVAHKGDERLFWDRGNWRALCRRHHSQKTARETWGRGADVTDTRTPANRAPVSFSHSRNPEGARHG